MEAAIGAGRKILISIGFGLFGFAVNFFPLEFDLVPIRASFLLGLTLPMMVAQAWGWRYGLLSATLGLGCQSMWFMWVSGWGMLASVPMFTLWVVWHGWWAGGLRNGRWRISPYCGEIPFRIVNVLVICLVFPWLMQFNPAPWGGTDQTAISLNALGLVCLKETINAYVVLLLSDALLRLRAVSRLLGLAEIRTVAFGPILAFALGFAAIFWFLSSVFALLGASHGRTFYQILISDIYGEELAARALFAITCLAGALGAARLIEKNRATKEKLLNSEVRFSRVVERSHVPMAITDTNVDLMYFNEEFGGHFGFTRDRLRDFSDWWKLAYPDPQYRRKAIRTWMEAVTEQTRSGAGVLHQRWDVTDVNGELHEVDFSFTWLDEGLGLTTYVDVTEQMRDQRELLQSKALLQGSSEQSLAGIIIFSAENNQPLFVNKEARRIFGFEEDYVGTPIPNYKYNFDAYSPDGVLYDKTDFPGVKILKKGVSIINEEARIVRPDGDELWLVGSGTPVLDDDGKMIAAVLVFQDITARKHLEEQLRHSQKMEAVGTLASGIAHDFNNILQAISGFAEMIRNRGGRADDNLKALDQIDRSVDRAAGLIRGLLTFGRNVQPLLKRLDLNHELRQSAAIIRRTIPPMIDVQTDLGPNLPDIAGDSIQLEQVLVNLASNARDAMPQGGVLRISTRSEDLDESRAEEIPGLLPGKYVRLTVADTGCGIESEHQKHIFEPFFTTKDVGQGTGLGLASVYGIISTHGGLINCTSQAGQGTEFSIWLPAVNGLPVRDKENEVSRLVAAVNGASVLVVDDEAELVAMVSDFLKDQGYEAWCANSGEQALELYQRHNFDVVVLDLGMPGMGGEACLERIVQMDSRARVIVASGYLEIHSDKWRKIGASATIPKPYRMDTLLSNIAEALA